MKNQKAVVYCSRADQARRVRNFLLSKKVTVEKGKHVLADRRTGGPVPLNHESGEPKIGERADNDAKTNHDDADTTRSVFVPYTRIAARFEIEHLDKDVTDMFCNSHILVVTSAVSCGYSYEKEGDFHTAYALIQFSDGTPDLHAMLQLFARVRSLASKEMKYHVQSTSLHKTVDHVDCGTASTMKELAETYVQTNSTSAAACHIAALNKVHQHAKVTNAKCIISKKYAREKAEMEIRNAFSTYNCDKDDYEKPTHEVITALGETSQNLLTARRMFRQMVADMPPAAKTTFTYQDRRGLMHPREVNAGVSAQTQDVEAIPMCIRGEDTHKVICGGAWRKRCGKNENECIQKKRQRKE